MKKEKFYKWQFKNFKLYCRDNRRGVILMALVILISLAAMGIANVRAGSLTPSASPAASGYTLGDIYTRLTTNATATAGNHALATTTSPAGSFYTLTQIYNAIPTIYATDLLASSTYLGITGLITVKTGNTPVASSSAQGTSLVFTIPPGYYDGADSATVATTSSVFTAGNIANGAYLFGLTGTLIGATGDAGAADVFSGKIFSTSTASNVAGTLNLACNTATFNGVGNLVADGYDGLGSGANRWCMATSTNGAGDAQILTGYKAWVNGVELTGVASSGYTYGDSIQSTVLTTAASAGTYNASNLTVGNVRYGQTFGVSSTGTMSPYPNTPSGISGLNQAVCTAASWTWVPDSNNDGVSDDPICVNPNRESAGATKVWSTSVGNDNTFIGNYGCSGDTNGDGVGTRNATLTGTVSENAGYGDDAATALAITDCKDGIRNLLSAAEVEASGYAAPDTDCTPTADDCYNGPLTTKALMEWKGTRLPSHNDFFGVCGNGTTSKTFGNYGNQIGRTDNVIAANLGSWEWLSEQYSYSNALIAGTYACSVFHSNGVTNSYGVRVVFRP